MVKFSELSQEEKELYFQSFTPVVQVNGQKFALFTSNKVELNRLRRVKKDELCCLCHRKENKCKYTSDNDNCYIRIKKA